MKELCNGHHKRHRWTQTLLCVSHEHLTNTCTRALMHAHTYTSHTHFSLGHSHPHTGPQWTTNTQTQPFSHPHLPMPCTPNHLPTHLPTQTYPLISDTPKDLLLLLPSELKHVHLTWLHPLSISSYTLLVLLSKGLKGVRRDTLWRTAHHQSSCWQGVHTLQHTTNKQALDEGQWSVVWRLGDVALTPPPALAYMYLPEGPHWREFPLSSVGFIQIVLVHFLSRMAILWPVGHTDTNIHDVVEAHCYVVDIGRTSCEQICGRINNNWCRTFQLRRPLP